MLQVSRCRDVARFSIVSSRRWLILTRPAHTRDTASATTTALASTHRSRNARCNHVPALSVAYDTVHHAYTCMYIE